MKKFLACAGLTLALGGCGGNEPTQGAQNTAPNAPSSAAKPTTQAPKGFAESAAERGWFRLNDRATMATAKQFTRCAIERVNGVKPVRGQLIGLSRGKDLSVSGWVADPQLHTPERFLVVLRSPHGTYATNATAGRKRPDVASALKSELLANAGYLSAKTLDVVAPGEYSVSLLQFADGQYVTCGSAARVTVE